MVITELESKANGAVHEIAPSGKRTVGYGEKGQKRGPMGVCSSGSHFTPLMMLCATAFKPEWTPKQTLCLYAQLP